MKTVKSRLFKKYLESRKSRAWLCLSLGWLYINGKKMLKTASLLLQELRIKEKLSVFGLTLTLILTIFGEHKKGELYILKMVGVSKFKKVL